jgi:parallel beta-helix repeat protein
MRALHKYYKKNATRPHFELLEERLTPSTFYVSPAGKDSAAGTVQAPWQTLQQAANVVVAGDTVDVEPGDYAGFVMGWNNPQNGTATAPITWNAQPGAVVTSRNGETADGIDLEYCSYIVINGFTVSNTGGTITRAGIRAAGESEGDVIEHNKVSGCGEWAIFTAFANSAQILDNVASNSQIQHGIYVSNSSDNDVVEGNTVFGNHDCGIQFNGDISQGDDGIMSNELIEDNVIYDNGTGGGSAINCDGLQNSQIVNNLLYDNHASGISLFQIDGGGPSIDNIVVSNTIVNASDSRWALNIQNGSTGNTAYNNILYDANPSHGSIDISSDSLSGFTSDHNIVVNAFTTDDGDRALGLSEWRTATGQDLHSEIATPAQLFVDPSSDNYQELPASPSIDAGTSLDAPGVDILGNPRPEGQGFDIGCYEYQTGEPPPPAVVGETPKPNSTRVPVTTTVSATFNEPVQSGTITFTLIGPNNSVVPATVSYTNSNDTAKLTPAAPLASSTNYTVKVSGALDQSGQSMTGVVTWSFTTAASTPKQPPVSVSKVRPVTNKKGQITEVRLTFSGALDAGLASEIAEYRLTIAGKGGSFTAQGAQAIGLRAAVYSAKNDLVILMPKKPFTLVKPVQLVVYGKSPFGLKDSLGRFIDGGTNYAALLRTG